MGGGAWQKNLPPGLELTDISNHSDRTGEVYSGTDQYGRSWEYRDNRGGTPQITYRDEGGVRHEVTPAGYGEWFDSYTDEHGRKITTNTGSEGPPPQLPPGLELTDKSSYTAPKLGETIHTATDQYGREWEWYENTDTGTRYAEYKDENGQSHQIRGPINGQWYDRSWDENGEVRNTPLGPDGPTPLLPPGLERRDQHTWTDENGIVHQVATDQYGRQWDWYRNENGTKRVEYQDEDGQWHQLLGGPLNGQWYESTRDENGEVKLTPLGPDGPPPRNQNEAGLAFLNNPDMAPEGEPAPGEPAANFAPAHETDDIVVVEPGDPRLGTSPRYKTHDEIEPTMEQRTAPPGEEGGEPLWTGPFVPDAEGAGVPPDDPNPHLTPEQEEQGRLFLEGERAMGSNLKLPEGVDLPEFKLAWGEAGVEPKEGGAPRTPTTGETGGTPTAPPETTPPPVDWRDLTLEQLQALTDLTPEQLQAQTGLTPGQLQGQLQALGCLEGQEGPRPAVDQAGLLTPPPVEPGEEGGWPERGPEGEYVIPEIERPDLYGPGAAPPPAGEAGERQPGTQTPEPTPAQPPPADGEGGIPGLGVPYRDFIPTFPMVKDTTTGQWRNAEPGEIPGPATEQSPPPVQPVQPAPPPEQPPVAEQQPAPAPPPHDGPANGGGAGLPDGDADGIPGEYGDGPDLDANGIPDEIGINPDSLQTGYPNPSTSGDGGGSEEGAAALDPTGGAHAGATYGSSDWGGVEVPDPTVVPQSDAATGAEAMPGDYGGGSAPDGGWAPEEAAIDPYALQQPAYADPSTSGEGAWDPYAGSSSEPYVPPAEEALPVEEAPVAEGEDPSTVGSF